MLILMIYFRQLYVDNVDELKKLMEIYHSKAFESLKKFHFTVWNTIFFCLAQFILDVYRNEIWNSILFICNRF